MDRESLYKDFQPLVNRLIRQYGSNDLEMRNDLAGEIYCRFCALLEVYDPSRGVPLRPYLVRQLTSSVYTYARQQWRNHRREASLEEIMEVKEPGNPVDPTPGWNDDLAMAQILKSLPEAIAQLPERQQQVVIWRYYEQRSYDDIAGMLAIRPATSRSIMRHGLNNLRKWVAANHANAL